MLAAGEATHFGAKPLQSPNVDFYLTHLPSRLRKPPCCRKISTNKANLNAGQLRSNLLKHI
eukprot:GDKH01007159.1.p2 GENE.GDKH01007159.1~~GDKH01007159.1.p2  ORF type:complete len:61 (+),score=0.35 GDKH01007159.1:583-765(+)